MLNFCRRHKILLQNAFGSLALTTVLSLLRMSETPGQAAAADEYRSLWFGDLNHMWLHMADWLPIDILVTFVASCGLCYVVSLAQNARNIPDQHGWRFARKVAGAFFLVFGNFAALMAASQYNWIYGLEVALVIGLGIYAVAAISYCLVKARAVTETRLRRIFRRKRPHLTLVKG